MTFTVTRFHLLLAVLLPGLSPAFAGADPLALHPDNPRYFIYRDKPAILISSAEHYGAVLNLDFDYVKYLDELAAHGLNHTRTFTGAYCEPQGAFKIEKNTLAPAPGRFIAPWRRSDKAGYANGGNKFDLTQFDDAYFRRLKDFVTQAGKRGIIVEVNLFCPFYEDMQWNLSPMNAANNVNGLGTVKRTDVYTLDKHGGLLGVHESMTRRIVSELRDADNIYYEICNEPYFGGVTMAWQQRIVEVIGEAQRDFKHKHLIALNIANGSQKVDKPIPGVAIYNFHYTSPPKCVAENWHLNLPIGENETGFKGTGDDHYRMEAWEFILAGGALYSHLDYSFAVGHEDGTFKYPGSQPGGGSRGYRVQMRVLKDFAHGFEFVKMKPANELVKGGLPAKGRASVLSEPGRQYAIYLHGGPEATLQLELPKGNYEATWINVLKGNTEQREVIDHTGGVAALKSPRFVKDIALRVRAR